jgi:hypothetical protein
VGCRGREHAPEDLSVLVGIVSFLAGWFTLGVAAIRLDRTAALKPA